MPSGQARTHLNACRKLVRSFGAPGREAIQTAGRLKKVTAQSRYLLDWYEHWLSRAALKRIFDPVPVDFATFVSSEHYLNEAEYVYPEVLREGAEFNHWAWDPEFGFRGRYVEGVLTGGIGSAKTSLAIYTQAYQAYLILCLRAPHRFFGLNPKTEILILLQSATGALAKGVDYERFRNMLEAAPWFQRYAPLDPKVKSEIVLPKNLKIKPVSGSAIAALGQNVVGAILDEVNFMLIVEQSKRAAGSDSQVFDQAKTNYNTIVRRRQSRFMKRGWVPGMLCIVSSKKFPGQFTDEKLEEAKSNPRIFVYDKRVFDIKPKGTYSEKCFWLFTGDEKAQPRVLLPGQSPPKGYSPTSWQQIPVDFYPDFRKDLYESIRDIAGVSIFATHPFFSNQDGVSKAFSGRNIFESPWCDFEVKRLAIDVSEVRDLPEWRFAHVDLALNSDSAGVAIGHVVGFESLVRSRGDDKPEVEVLPKIVIDGVLEVRAPAGGEINFGRIRDVFYALRKLGMALRWISYDSWQSVDSAQILRSNRFITGNISLDRTILPYDIFRTAVNDGRVRGPEHAKLRRELREVQVDPKKAKIDHPPRGSKDLADAVAGVVFGITGRREVWARHGVKPVQIPPSLQAAFRTMQDAEAKAAAAAAGSIEAA